jgi:hypothetical protein
VDFGGFEKIILSCQFNPIRANRGVSDMLTLNTILRREGINLSSVRLVRHADTRGPGPSPYDLWLRRSKEDRFERYQRLQKKPVKFNVGHLLASFVVPSPKESLFVGLYSVDGTVDPAPPGTICPVLQTDCGAGGHVLFDITSILDYPVYRPIGD